MQKVLVGCFNAKPLFCGDNFTFGARAAGNVERLRELCAPLGIGVHIVPMAQYSGQTVSSTRIRAALEEGRLDDANAMLGTPYAIDWPVVHGKGIGSGKLGTPTLNQNYPAAALQPCAGVRKFNSMDELAALIHHAADESKAYFAALNGAK